MTTKPRADESRTVAIAGANGMVGHHLVEALQVSGDRVIALVRQPSAHHFPSAVEIRRWQASDPVAPVDGAHAVVNLVGDPIFARPWSQARKQELPNTAACDPLARGGYPQDRRRRMHLHFFHCRRVRGRYWRSAGR